jgi:hypothetical protein
MYKSKLFLLLSFIFISLTSEDCSQKARSSSGVSKATAKVTTDLDGRTQEQLNILEKIKRDSEIGKVRHLYIISAYTGEVLEYYSIKGKITSGSKRLNPKTVRTANNSGAYEISPNIYTDEMLSDDGTYGESNNYFYFFDTLDNYHQVFPTGGTYTRISDRPLTIKKSSLIFK